MSYENDQFGSSVVFSHVYNAIYGFISFKPPDLNETS